MEDGGVTAACVRMCNQRLMASRFCNEIFNRLSCFQVELPPHHELENRLRNSPMLKYLLAVSLAVIWLRGVCYAWIDYPANGYASMTHYGLPS